METGLPDVILVSKILLLLLLTQCWKSSVLIVEEKEHNLLKVKEKISISLWRDHCSTVVAGDLWSHCIALDGLELTMEA